MPINSVFQSGDSPAIQQAKEPDIDVDKVEVFRREDKLKLNLRAINGAVVFDVLTRLPADFMQDNRDDIPPKKR